MEENNLIEWTPSSMLEVTLNEPDDFLKVRETFKELFLLDGKKSNLEENDIARRNTIATLMSDWGLVTIEGKGKVEPLAPLRQIKIIPFKEKNQWTLKQNYTIGKNKNN